jgi:hypothetical protein
MKAVTVFDADKPPQDKQEQRETGANEPKKQQNQIKFYGQHEDERILYEVHPHPFGKYLTLAKLGFVAVMLWLSFFMVGSVIPRVEGKVEPIGFWLGLGVLVVGVILVRNQNKENVGYITDRRIVRFKSGSLFTVNSRTLSWDEAAKVKTYSPNFILRMLNIGTVVVHAKTTVVQMSDTPQSRNFMTDDDVELTDVHFYKDLGNYIDKVMFVFKRKPEELETMRPFVALARGKRY